MKLTVSKPTEIEADAIRLVLPVKYDEEDMPNDFPRRIRNVWDVTVDLETGRIRDWPADFGKFNLYMKVTDAGRYFLLNGDAVVASREYTYVPSCVPGEYGDYVNLKIDGGRITNWEPSRRDVARSFFGGEDD